MCIRDSTRATYRTLLYPAPRRGLERAPEGAELRHYPTEDGAQVQVVVYPGRGESVLVYFHGNGESIADSVPLGREMQRRGLGFAAVEYRGYGHSPAEGPTEAGLYADAQGALVGLRDDGVRPETTTLWGNSLGTGVAVEMATRGHGSRLILPAPYTSIPDVAARIAPFLPTRLLIGDRFDSFDKAPSITLPTLVIHGDHDRVVPLSLIHI